MGARMDDTYWYFAAQYAVQLLNNCVNRMTGNLLRLVMQRH